MDMVLIFMVRTQIFYTSCSALYGETAISTPCSDQSSILYYSL